MYIFTVLFVFHTPRETSPGVWQTAYVHRFHDSSVNGLSFAPHELGLILACASSDGKVSILQHQVNGSTSFSCSVLVAPS